MLVWKFLGKIVLREEFAVGFGASSFFGRAIGCALSFCLVTGPVLAGAGPAFADEIAASSNGATTASTETSPTVVREDVTKRTENSKHFLLSDGSYRAKVGSAPLHYRQNEGWADIDARLVPGDEIGEYSSAGLPATVTVGAQTSDSAPVALSGEDWSVGIDMLGATEVAKVVIGDRATYLNVAPETDLTYEALADGIKETLVLASADAPTDFSFRVDLEGLSAVADFCGGIALQHADGSPSGLALSRLLVTDSSLDSEGRAAVCEDAVMTVESVPGGLIVDYSIPESWMRDPARVFPVLVDPTITSATATYVDQYTPGASYGTSTRMNVGKLTTGVQQTFAFWNLGDANLPTNANVLSADASLWLVYAYTAATEKLGKVTGAWSESCTYSTRPSSALVSTQYVSGSNKWVSWAVDDTVRDWFYGRVTNWGLAFTQDATTGSRHEYASDDESYVAHRPTLTIDYEVPTDSVSGHASSYKVGDTITTTVRVNTALPSRMREVRLLPNQSVPSKWRGNFGWFAYSPDSNWHPQPAPGGGYFGYLDPAYGGDKVNELVSQWSVSNGTGYKDVTFKWTIQDNYGDIQDNDLETYFQTGTASLADLSSGWKNHNTNIDILPAPVTDATATTTASDWFREVDRNGDDVADTANDLPDVGRGAVELSWQPSEIADGYIIKMTDGKVIQQVGKVYGSNTTTWSTEGLGIYPSGSEIASMGSDDGYTGNPFSSASAPREATRFSEPIEVAGADGAGVVVTDGTHLYVRSWSNIAGPTSWQKVGTGLHGTTAGEDGGTVGPDFAAKPIKSAFMLDGYIYNGYVDMVGGQASATGVWKAASAGEVALRALEFTAPPLNRASGEPLLTSSGDVQLAADEEHIYSVAYMAASGYPNWKVRVYDRDGTFLRDRTVATPSYYTDCVISDGSALYLIEWGGEHRVTKVRLSDFAVANQWSIGDQATTQEIAGCYDAANDRFWLGALTEGKVYAHTGPGLDLADDPNQVYRKILGGTLYDAHNYEFRVVPFNDAGDDVLANEPVVVTLDNRTVRVDDNPRHTEHSLGDMAGNSAIAGIDTGALALDTTDLSVKSWGPAADVSRHYDSSAQETISLSRGWRFSFEQTLVETVAGQRAVYTDSTGEEHTFRYSSDAGGWIAPNGFWGTLVKHEPAFSDDTWTLELKDHTVLTFSEPGGELLSEVDRNGNVVSYSRSGGDLTIEAANGQRIVVDYENGSVVAATHRTAGDQPLSRIEYDTSGNQLVVTRAAQDSAVSYETVYTYADGRISGIDVPSVSSSWVVEYATDGTLRAVSNDSTDTPAMRRELTRNAASREATVSTFDGVTVYKYNPTGTCAISSTEGSATLLTTMEYDSANLPTRELTPTGRETKRTYNSDGDVTFEWDAEGRMSSFVYNAAGDLLRGTDGGGSTTYRTYDGCGNVLTEEKTLTKSGEKSQTAYEYEDAGSHRGRMVCQLSRIDASHIAYTTYSAFDEVTGEAESVSDQGVRLASGDAARTLTRQSAYNDRGDLISETDALGVTSATNAYDSLGRVIESTDASGVVTHTKYDRIGNTTETWRSHESTAAKLDWRTMTYNGASLLMTETVKDSDGATISTVNHTYDALGRETKADDSLVPGVASTTYDAQGNAVVSAVEGASPETSGSVRTTFNAEGEEVSTLEPGATSAATETSYTVDGQVATQTNPDGSATATTYDAAGNVASEAESSHVGTATTTYQNDLDGRTTSSTAPDGSVTTYTYDLLGRQTGAQIAGQNISTTEYNSLGWVLKETDFDGTVKTKTYDAVGRLVADTISGLETTHAFDACGREIAKTNPDGSAYSFTFDAFGRPVREIQTGTDASTVKDTRTTYDAVGRVASMSESVAGLTRAYAYGSAGSVTVATTRGSHTTTSTLDGTGQLRSVTSMLDGRALDLSVTATDTAGRVTGWRSYAFATSWALAYDQAGRPYLQKTSRRRAKVQSAAAWAHSHSRRAETWVHPRTSTIRPRARRYVTTSISPMVAPRTPPTPTAPPTA